MSKKGVPIKAEVRERIRQGQLARWERIRGQLAQAEIHEKHCEDEHLTNMVHPRCNGDHNDHQTLRDRLWDEGHQVRSKTWKTQIMPASVRR